MAGAGVAGGGAGVAGAAGAAGVAGAVVAGAGVAGVAGALGVPTLGVAGLAGAAGAAGVAGGEPAAGVEAAAAGALAFPCTFVVFDGATGAPAGGWAGLAAEPEFVEVSVFDAGFGAAGVLEDVDPAGVVVPEVDVWLQAVGTTLRVASSRPQTLTLRVLFRKMDARKWAPIRVRCRYGLVDMSPNKKDGR